MITTSRYASSETRDAAKNFSKTNLILYSSRGKKTISDLVLFARKKGESNILILQENKNKPSNILVIEIDSLGNWKWKEKINLLI